MGVDQTFSGARAPQQNAKPERKNRTLDEEITTIMLHSGAPGCMWGEALNWTVFVHNNLPYKEVDGVWHSRRSLFTKSPKQFKVSNLRPFGCRAWGYLPVEAREGYKSHLRMKCYPGIFLGYSKQGNIVR